jgi:hypothetical protein
MTFADLVQKCRGWVDSGHAATSVGCPGYPRAEIGGRSSFEQDRVDLLAGHLTDLIEPVRDPALMEELAALSAHKVDEELNRRERDGWRLVSGDGPAASGKPCTKGLAAAGRQPPSNS